MSLGTAPARGGMITSASGPWATTPTGPPVLVSAAATARSALRRETVVWSGALTPPVFGDLRSNVPSGG
ncbi:hypothetical protein [Azospirillum formosense]|uniref:hypothetical protein n=1 Tax=Azospirillum formosense TaxID=861533 RepID=UPI00157A4D98|nr:hypothetical protein [Azospirillum formosense]